jgi:hypothetical protein
LCREIYFLYLLTHPHNDPSDFSGGFFIDILPSIFPAALFIVILASNFPGHFFFEIFCGLILQNVFCFEIFALPPHFSRLPSSPFTSHFSLKNVGITIVNIVPSFSSDLTISVPLFKPIIRFANASPSPKPAFPSEVLDL